MKRLSKLSKQARENIKQFMIDNGQMTTDEAMAMVEPHYMFDPQTAKRAEIRQVVHRIMRSIKGVAGKRACFNLKDAESRYINIETTTSLNALDGVERQLDAQFFGLSDSKYRIAKRRRVLIGQLGLPDVFDE